MQFSYLCFVLLQLQQALGTSTRLSDLALANVEAVTIGENGKTTTSNK